MSITCPCCGAEISDDGDLLADDEQVCSVCGDHCTTGREFDGEVFCMICAPDEEGDS